MLWIQGSAADLRRGWTRRDCLRVGLGGALAFRGARQGWAESASKTASGPSRSFGQARSCIFIYLFGGPSHIDIWDMKPAAPADFRGEFRPQATNVPGIEITEHLPRLARHADKYALLRSLTHGDPAHGSAGHAMLTGRMMREGDLPPSADDFPHYGAVLARLRPKQAMTSFVSLPQVIATSTNVVPGQNAGFLGRGLDPVRLQRPPEDTLNFTSPLPSLPAEITRWRVGQRAQLLEQLEAQGPFGRDASGADWDKLVQRTLQFIDSPQAASAFRLDLEPDAVRDRYGRNVFGQSVLLARRLSEAGVPMTLVAWPDRTEPEAFLNNGTLDKVPVPMWDMHGKPVGNTPIFPTLKEQALPTLDVAVSALFEDLSARGLLEETLVVVTGEFGRTPRVDSKWQGRNHYGHVFSGLLAGGGIRGGQVYGASDKYAAFPAVDPVLPKDFAATLYHCLGVPPDAEMTDDLGRPHLVTADGRPVAGLLL